MTDEPKLCFNKVDGSISVNMGDVDVDLYSDATQEEFEQIRDVDQLMTEASGLLDSMLQTMGAQQSLISKGRYFDRQKTLQENAAEYFAQCVDLQDDLKESKSDIVTAQLGMLYKLEKFLKHYLRCLSVAQSLGYSQRLALNYAATGDYVFLYGFVRNACSTIEYLGKLVKTGWGSDRTRRVWDELCTCL
ncbi:hypothetical protein NDI76_22410 [Halogeometricum sp. S1BR25-6]|uniref:Uncharacterized protein n=1 Tax=Halogeometricum salsisoli TaxID=2950536 RepID=A0ABU2GKY1_9EURY|nr:hypothetical protein [Halogeometricum sp. S1BR25-6]MDS0301482.1 hypothetical protein [Halogeometricum sp. S1BR25-6]